MRRILLIGSTVFLLATPVLVIGQKAPAFSSYPAKVEKAQTRSIDFQRSPGANTFKTRLKAALAEGTDFAGHYRIAGWGCGTGCISGAVIDVRDGRVYFPEELAALSVGYFSGDYESEPLKYRKNSRLMVLSGIPGRIDENKPQKPWGDYYFEWKNNRFRQVRYVKRDNPQ